MNEVNLALYERVRTVPDTAQKTIEAGRLKGKTDINPMWRIKKLTEEFGPCGEGWYIKELNKWMERGANDEIAAFVDIELYVMINGEWSKPIHGSGGSMFVAKEKNGLYTDDECFKKAYTDAISVACKALGIGADVYWDKDSTKYTPRPTGEPAGKTYGENAQQDKTQTRTERVTALIKNSGYHFSDVNDLIDSKFGRGKTLNDLTEEQYDTIIKILIKAVVGKHE